MLQVLLFFAEKRKIVKKIATFFGKKNHRENWDKKETKGYFPNAKAPKQIYFDEKQKKKAIEYKTAFKLLVWSLNTMATGVAIFKKNLEN